jgi:hypothetical protein
MPHLFDSGHAGEGSSSRNQSCCPTAPPGLPLLVANSAGRLIRYVS